MKKLSLQNFKLQETPRKEKSGPQQATQHSQWLRQVLNELAPSNDKVDKQIVEDIRSQLGLKSSEYDCH